MTMSEASKAILISQNLRITDCRTDVIQFFIEGKAAFSQRDLENEYKQYDRVTIYRTLNSLLKAGVLHKIPNESGAATYGLCHYTSTPEHHFDNHIHFNCKNCGQIECLEDKEVPQVSVPSGYTIERINLIVAGVCTKCA